MSALQILLINLVADTAIGIGFAKDRVRQMSIMKRTSKKFPSMVEYTFALLLAVAVAVSIGVLTTTPLAKGYESSIAMAALTVGVMTLMVNWESMEESVIRILPKVSARIILSLAIVLGIALVVLYLPQANVIFGFKPLTFEHWKQIALIAPLLTVLFEIKKRFVR
jgi:magnesium-transporting ATPase (P-type)